MPWPKTAPCVIRFRVSFQKSVSQNRVGMGFRSIGGRNRNRLHHQGAARLHSGCHGLCRRCAKGQCRSSSTLPCAPRCRVFAIDHCFRRLGRVDSAMLPLLAQTPFQINFIDDGTCYDWYVTANPTSSTLPSAGLGKNQLTSSSTSGSQIVVTADQPVRCFCTSNRKDCTRSSTCFVSTLWLRSAIVFFSS